MLKLNFTHVLFCQNSILSLFIFIIIINKFNGVRNQTENKYLAGKNNKTALIYSEMSQNTLKRIILKNNMHLK